jgi:hypothetical protein
VVTRNDQVLRDSHSRDRELEWYLRTEASTRVRDTELAGLLKRKGLAWLRQRRPDLTEMDKHFQLATAINNAMLDNKIDQSYRVMLNRQDPTQITAFNHYVKGKRLSKPGTFLRLLYWMGMKKVADRAWLLTARAVLPPPV